MDQETQDTPQVAVEESDADLEAGFAAVRGGEQPAPQTQPDPQASAPSAEAQPAEQPDQGISNVAESTEKVEPEQKEPTTAELMAQISQLQSSIRNIAGNFGGLKSDLQRQLQQLSQIRASEPQGSPAARGAEKAQALLLKRVRENWPDFAEDLAADLEETLGAAKAAPAVDPAEIERRVESRVGQRMAEVEQKLAADTLDVLLPNWQEEISTKDAAGNVILDSTGKLIPSKEFTSWLDSKGEQFRATWWNTNSPKFLIGALNEFKAHTEKAQQTRSTKQDRLKSAVVPQGRASTVVQPDIDEEAAMARGFQQVRGGAFR